MIKLGLFVKNYNEDPVYTRHLCLETETVEGIMLECHINKNGASVFLNGKYLDEKEWKKSLTALKTSSPAFLSVRYGEERPKQAKPVFNRGRR